jgi:predicted methyltransferase MtxX (methanogen marker protein 4)
LAAAQVDATVGPAHASDQISSSQQEIDFLLVSSHHFHQAVVEPSHRAVDDERQIGHQQQTIHQKQQEKEFLLALVVDAPISGSAASSQVRSTLRCQIEFDATTVNSSYTAID